VPKCGGKKSVKRATIEKKNERATGGEGRWRAQLKKKQRDYQGQVTGHGGTGTRRERLNDLKRKGQH